MTCIMSAFYKGKIIQETETVYIAQSTKIPKPVQLLYAKRKSTDRDCHQQSFLIGLLISIGYSITIKKPHKKSKTTSQMFVILEIRKEITTILSNDSFDESFVDIKKRRRERDVLTNNILIEQIQSHQGLVEFKKNNKIELNKFRRIKTLKYNNINYNQSDIYLIGKSINNFILQIMGSNDCYLQPNDLRITKYFKLNQK
ncbi:hypothetical protein EDI_145810 [Entamoeba dispar SAW760]|uniref:Uncharacterized protein n=1 Tax=Entamoeba dispar (strain ATCC PRA-260 / SAW760) TaxID=370354 RepID=B0EU94_ENTDS|nr:uncharacterized protein EDI_145810 [Entamoeba dispar SAW760]EDR21883.1 hypothetical protein EDI_145810 [Entamoeba dispar SAW760]|eukprot:EDR21883.1 hypothetical protein EDI_145810 [Entamoeba dispar SAW760]